MPVQTMPKVCICPKCGVERVIESFGTWAKASGMYVSQYSECQVCRSATAFDYWRNTVPPLSQTYPGFMQSDGVVLAMDVSTARLVRDTIARSLASTSSADRMTEANRDAVWAMLHALSVGIAEKTKKDRVTGL